MKLNKSILAKLKGKKILVIGDLMLDEYIIGNVTRISPEAPVPVVSVTEQFVRFGGAANVCLNIASLGATAIPIGVIGNDDYSEQFLNRANINQIDCKYVLKSNLRPTTVKTRVIGGSQQIVRFDKELADDLAKQEQDILMNNIEHAIKEADAIILQDYNKGVITEFIIKSVLKLAKSKSIPVFVDPKFHHFFDYKNVFLFKPNIREITKALQITANSDNDYKKAASVLKDKIRAKNILLTLGSEGMLLLDENNDFHQIAAKSVEVADVSGAGDTVIATLVSSFVAGLSVKDATIIANNAAGIVVQELGIVPILPEQLR